MDAKDSAPAADAPVISIAPTSQPKSTSEHGGDKLNDNSTTSGPRQAVNDDDEEEEGMLKVDEEGQIDEDDSIHSKVSRPRPSANERAIPLADRLVPLSDASSKKTASTAPSTTTKNGHSSPRHTSSDRDRYHDASPGPASSYASQRSRFGYPAEGGSTYGAGASAYAYPPRDRDAVRPEPYASSSRNSFAGTASRADNTRGWYSTSSGTPTPRGSDTYRPGANRDRERGRDRDWDSFRDGDRDRDWERERDAYRDAVDKRRDWPSRERGAPPSAYEAGDSYAPYSTSATSKYGYDARDYADRRPASPSASLSRDRDYDADRSRDRDRDRASERDPRAREPSSGRAGGGMRQWGKPSDASTRGGPASEDARSDTSQPQATFRSNTTQPEAGIKPGTSGLAPEKDEAKSRDMPPLSTHRTDKSNKDEAQAAAPPSSEAGSLPPSAAAGAQDAKLEHESPMGLASEAQNTGVSEPMAVERTKGDIAGAASESLTAATQLVTEQIQGDNVPDADASLPKTGASDAREVVQAIEPLPNERPAVIQVEETAAAQASAAAAAPADPSLAQNKASQPEPQEVQSQPESNDAQLPNESNGDAEQADASATPQAHDSLEVDASHPEVETVPSSTEPAPAGVPSATASSHTQDEPVQSQTDEVTHPPVTHQSDADPTQPSTTIADDMKTEEVTEAPSAIHGSAASIAREPISTAVPQPQDALVEAAEQQAAADVLATSEQTDGPNADIEMVDAAPEHVQAPEQLANQEIDATETAFAPPALVEAGRDLDVDGTSKASATAESADPAEVTQLPALSGADGIAGEQQLDTLTEVAAAGPEVDVEMQSVDQTHIETSAPEAPIEVVEKSLVVDETPVKPQESEIEAADLAATEPAPSTVEVNIKTEEEQPAQIGDVSMAEATDETNPSVPPVEQDSKNEGPIDEPVPAVDADAASVVEAASAVVLVSEPQTGEANLPPSTSSQIQVSGPHVTATIDVQAQIQEITLPHVDYGDDKEARALAEQETARIEEVEMPAPDEQEPSLRIAEIDDADKDIEPPLMTPSTQEEVDKAIHFALRQHITEDKSLKDDWKRILKENQIVSQRTTMDVLKAKIHGIPLIVSSDQPLWLEDDDKQAERTKAQLFPQLLDRKKRLNAKIESLKKRYRSINEEWKLHCQRLDRSAERREMLRRPPANTPAGTPGVFGVEEPSPGGGGGGGGGLLSASLTTGRANRRSAQTGGFAGFGDAVRSEAEFLEILASLENADMQDPNMRAARTTATAPDMAINVDSDQLTKLRYDDLNGFVADPLAFYLDEFDPDVWSEEEKAIFARRYALWPKQFGKIAQALPHKTPAQCVRYYYLNKKVPGNDFKALAAARNRERKRKARVKPKKAKGSALMADLKSAKGEEVDDVEDGSGLRSPVEAVDPTAPLPDVPVTSNGRRGGRARMVPGTVEGVSEEVAAGRKRPADQGESDVKGGDAKTDKRKSGSKSKRAKSDSASATDKSRKSKSGGKKDLATLDEASSSASTGVKAEGIDEITPASAPPAAHPAEDKPRLEDSDLAAAEALAGLFGGPATGDINTAADGVPGELDADGRKAGKKRRSKTAVPGEEGAEVGGGKGRGKQPTSSYWSVAERYEFLRALVTHGPRWEVVSSTLAQKSTAQARNYFARNEDEVDFAEAAALARSHADAPLADREAAALAFVRQRFASNSASAVPSLPSAAGAVPALVPGFGNEAIPGTTHLPPPPGISSFHSDAMDAKMRDESPEPVAPRRGLQINSLLNDTADAASHRTARRSSLHDWQAERGEPAHPAVSRDASVPPSLYARQGRDLDSRPLTADHLEAGRPVSSDGRPIRDDHDGRARAFDRLDMHRSAAEGRDPRDEAVESRPWMYDSPYEAHRRPMASSGYAPMAPPSHPADRSVTASRYSMPPSSVSSAGHVARSAPPMPSHASSSDDVEVERERERERERDRAGYDMYGASGRSREHESHSMPPSVQGELRRGGSGEQISPTGAHFGASHGYSRYPTTGVGSLYASTTAASAALASRSRPANGPLTAPLPSTSERPAYEQRWRGYSQSPGPTSAGSGAAHLSSSSAGGYSTASAYRSSNSPYSSFPSQSLPRPSLPSLSASGGKVGAPHLPSLGAAGRSLPPILGTFPAPGRSALGAGSRPAGTGEEARYWPYPHRPRGHDQGPSSRTPE